MIWKFDYGEPLTQVEHDHWMRHPLPFGWAIVAPPRALEVAGEPGLEPGAFGFGDRRSST